MLSKVLSYRAPLNLGPEKKNISLIYMIGVVFRQADFPNDEIYHG